MKMKSVSLLLLLTVFFTFIYGCSGNDTTGSPESNDIQPTVNKNNSFIDTQNSLIKTINGNQYYWADYIYKLNETECECVELTTDEQAAQPKGKIVHTISEVPADIDEINTVFDDREIYYVNNSYHDKGIYHLTVINDKNIDEELLYSWKDICSELADGIVKEIKSGTVKSDEIKDEIKIYRLRDGNDGFVYFSLGTESNGAANYIRNRLGRFAKDGSKAELLPNILPATDGNFSAYTISNGTIYYADNGYNYRDYGKYGYDVNRAGIYSIGTDGKNKKMLLEKIYSNTEISEKDNNENGSDSFYPVKNLEIVGDHLYYINASAEGRELLYRISLEGGTPEKMSEYPCANYYIDLLNNRLFYWGRRESREMKTHQCYFFERSLLNSDEQPFWKYSPQNLYFKFNGSSDSVDHFNVNIDNFHESVSAFVYHDYIYFSSSEFMNQKHINYYNGVKYDIFNYEKVSGLRYNPKENKMESLYSHCVVNIENGSESRDKYYCEWLDSEGIYEKMTQKKNDAIKLKEEGKLDDESFLNYDLREYYTDLSERNVSHIRDMWNKMDDLEKQPSDESSENDEVVKAIPSGKLLKPKRSLR